MIPPERDASFVAANEALLKVYPAPPDPDRPLVWFDEGGKELHAHVRSPQPLRPVRPAREDSNYQRRGSAPLFLSCAPQLGWRQVRVAEQRTGVDRALAIRDLVDVHFAGAQQTILVLDNLNTHRLPSPNTAFPAPEARRIARKLELHFTPKHGSWLNMAESELHALGQQCLRRRIPDRATLEREVAAWVAARNAERVTVQWQSSVTDAPSLSHPDMRHQWVDTPLSSSKLLCAKKTYRTSGTGQLGTDTHPRSR